MKKTITTSIFMLLLFSTTLIRAQEIINMAPNSGYPGKELDVVLYGLNTHFYNGVSNANFGSGITVKSLVVHNTTTATARIYIAQNAIADLRTVSVVTSSERATMDDGFEVFEPGANVSAMITVVPVKVLYLADFDLNNMSDAPVYFTITVFNDQVKRDLKLRLTISGEAYGDLIVAEKTYKQVGPSAQLNLTNRDFDAYNTLLASQAFQDVVAETGMVPPDVYRYSLSVYDDNGLLIASDEVDNPIENPTSQLELIGPGSSLDESPEILPKSSPFLQWFSDAATFDLALYEVREGQSNAIDIASNLPVFKAEGISCCQYLYPNYAEQLQVGVTYAWQVQANVLSSGGDQQFPSQMLWFSVGNANPNTAPVARIEVEPIEMELSIGGSFQFTAVAFDVNDELLDVPIKWELVPANVGEISETGLLTAGNRPQTFAVVATSGDIQNYAMVTIKWKADQYFEWNILDELFGLPQQN